MKILVDEEEEEETAAEKRLRLAKEYIAQVEEEGILCCSTLQQRIADDAVCVCVLVCQS